jgi:predicted ATPase
MTTKYPLDKLNIRGFLSIQNLEEFPLKQLNVLIGSNGAGKSNFVTYFAMLRELVEQRLQVWVAKQGGHDRVLTYGAKVTEQLESSLWFDRHFYRFALQPTISGGFVFSEEIATYIDDILNPIYYLGGLGGNKEAELKTVAQSEALDYIDATVKACYESILSWKTYHFHDTSMNAPVKQKRALHDNAYLRSDGANLAAYLNKLQAKSPETYQQIRRVIQLAIPFFDDFVLNPEELPGGEQVISLQWRQKDSDYPFWVSQLSDGSLRFICLATALLQPDPPATIILDEPEIGLHPYALTLLASLISSAAIESQIILTTQSVQFVNEFSIDDFIVVERQEGVSTFRWLAEADFQLWLEDYSVGELWEKNVLGGRPPR